MMSFFRELVKHFKKVLKEKTIIIKVYNIEELEQKKLQTLFVIWYNINYESNTKKLIDFTAFYEMDRWEASITSDYKVSYARQL